MVFWYKADNHPPFKMGAPEFWQHHSNNYTDKGAENEDEMDISQIKKKNTVNLIVVVNDTRFFC